jgi:DnaK suppressor protein
MSKKPAPTEDNQGGVYRRILLDIRASTLASLGAKTQVLSAGDRACEEDQAQHSLAEAVSLRLNGLEYMQLRQIQEALDRLQLGDYGICLSCEQPIPAKRLLAVPWAKYCVGCQEGLADLLGEE